MKKTDLTLSMTKNCNLDLCLCTPSPVSLQSSGDDYMNEGSTRSPQKVTIFYGGRVCVCDLTELQARAIIGLARTKMEENAETPHSKPVMPSLQSQLHSPPHISLKKSLQQFLEKRKKRIKASSPYHKQ